MRRVAVSVVAILASMAVGCSIMGPQASRHQGITDSNPDAVVREFPATATQMAKIMADVVASDPILDKVSLTPAGGREYRNFSKADREALGISGLTLANDVNWNVEAKSKDGHVVTVAVRLKGESSSEISVLYGSRGNDEFSKDLLDKAQAELARAKDPAVIKASGVKSVANKDSKP